MCAWTFWAQPIVKEQCPEQNMVPFLSPVACTVPHLVPAANVGVAPVAAGKTAVAPAAYTVPDVYATAPVADEEHAGAVEVKAALPLSPQ